MAKKNEENTAFYSREDLKEFEILVNQKLADARSEHKRLSDNLKDGGGDGSDRMSITNLGTESRDREETEILMARQEKFILNLEYAMARIKNGTYGKCKVTGKLIPKERLRIVPHTTTSIEAKNQQDNTPQNRG